MQRLVEKCLDDALPELRPWDDNEVSPDGTKKPGFSFLCDVASLNVAHGNYEMVAQMEKKFDYDLHSHFEAADAFYNHHIHVDWQDYSDFVEGGGSKS